MWQTVCKRSHSSDRSPFYLWQIKWMLKNCAVPKLYDLYHRRFFAPEIPLVRFLLQGGKTCFTYTNFG